MFSARRRNEEDLVDVRGNDEDHERGNNVNEQVAVPPTVVSQQSSSNHDSGDLVESGRNQDNLQSNGNQDNLQDSQSDQAPQNIVPQIVNIEPTR